MNDLVDALSNKWREQAFPYQVLWFDDRFNAYRNLLLGRQSGVTMAMAIEAGIMSLEQGRKQVFIASTLAQAQIFQYYLEAWFEPAVLKLIKAEFVSVRSVSEQDLSNTDVYIDSYLYIADKGLSEIVNALDVYQVNRVTWISARRPEPKYKLMEAVTFKGAENHMGISISPLLLSKKERDCA